MTNMEKLRKFLSPHVPCLSWNYKGQAETKLSFLYDTQKDWNQTLVTKINQTSAYIFRDNLRGGANVLLIPESMKELFKTLEYFEPEQHDYMIGILSGTYIVYAIPKLTEVTLEMYGGSHGKEMVTYDESKIFVCKLKNTDDILDTENYLKVGVVRVEQLVEVNLFK